MNVNVQIVLGVNEYAADLSGNATELAQSILEAIGGDEAKDVVSVNISDSGTAGYTMIPPSPGPNPEPPNDVTVNSTFTTQNSPPPGDKQTRTNAASSSDVTAVYVDDQSTEGNDISTQLLALVAGDQFQIRSVANSNRYMTFTITAVPLDRTDFVELPVNFVETGGDPANGACVLTFPSRPTP